MKETGNIEVIQKINKACLFLIQEGKSQKEIVETLNYQNKLVKKFRSSDKFIGESTLSEYSSAKSYSNRINAKKAWKILKALEFHIDKDFNSIWDNDAKDYLSLDELDYQKNIKKLNVLLGTWEAYTWDDSLTKETGEGYVHCFRLKIEGSKNIICSTEESSFESGKIFLIGFQKICIEIFHSSRKAFFILDLGNSKEEDLMGQDNLTLAYVDSGRYAVRAGLMAIKKTKIPYEDIVCGSKPISELKAHWPALEKKLKDKQFVIT